MTESNNLNYNIYKHDSKVYNYKTARSELLSRGEGSWTNIKVDKKMIASTITKTKDTPFRLVGLSFAVTGMIAAMSLTTTYNPENSCNHEYYPNYLHENIM